jgi:hypothetical protein
MATFLCHFVLRPKVICLTCELSLLVFVCIFMLSLYMFHRVLNKVLDIITVFYLNPSIELLGYQPLASCYD